MSLVALPIMAQEDEIRRLNTLYQLLAGLNDAKSVEDIYETALGSLLAATSADRAAILTFDDDGVIGFKASRGLSAAYQQAMTGHIPWPRGRLAPEPTIVPDVLEDESLAAYRRALEKEQIRALAFIPLAFDSGVFGNITLYYSEPHDFLHGELEMAQAIAAHVATAIRRGIATDITEMKGLETATVRLAAIVESSD